MSLAGSPLLVRLRASCRAVVGWTDPRHQLVVVLVGAALLALSLQRGVARTPRSDPPFVTFGGAVAAGSGTIFVAGNRMTKGKRGPGTVHVFQRRDSRWVRVDILSVPESTFQDSFGVSMAVDGDTLVVGAQFADSRGKDSGLAYVFERRAERWHRAAVLSAGDASAGDQFGLTVSVSGETIVVGARLSHSRGTDAGAAYVFTRHDRRWQQVNKLMASDAAAGDLFGRASIETNAMIVSADLNDDRGTNAGKAYFLERRGGAWVETAKVTAPNGTEGDEFGISLALAGSTAVFGAVGDASAGVDTGAAYVFERGDGKWTQMGRLTPSDPAPKQWFGFSVATGNGTIVVGAPNHHSQGKRAGAAYVFERRAGEWTQVGRLTASDAVPGTWFGNAVAISGDTIVVGMLLNGEGKRSGSAYVFERRRGEWSEIARLGPEVTVP
jgi:FG-GAP repeat protein